MLDLAQVAGVAADISERTASAGAKAPAFCVSPRNVIEPPPVIAGLSEVAYQSDTQPRNVIEPPPVIAGIINIVNDSSRLLAT